MAILQATDERVYVQVTHPYAGAIPNTTGTASLANTHYLPHAKVVLGGFGSQSIPSRAKTGAKGRLPGLLGRSGGERWTLDVPVWGSGTAGTAPDLDQIFEAIFGAAGTDNAGTDVTYALSNAVPELTIWSFRTAAGSATNVVQRCAWGALLDEFEISTGDGELNLTCGGTCSFVLPSAGFASFTTAQKGGLSAFPTEPSGASALGGGIPAFTGSLDIDGVSSFKVESFSIRGRLNRSARYAFGARVANVPAAGIRDISFSVTLYEENTSAMNTLRDLQRSGSAVDCELVFGETAGKILTFGLNNVIFPSESVNDDQAEYRLSFNDVPAGMTDASTADELTLVLT